MNVSYFKTTADYNDDYNRTMSWTETYSIGWIDLDDDDAVTKWQQQKNGSWINCYTFREKIIKMKST